MGDGLWLASLRLDSAALSTINRVSITKSAKRSLGSWITSAIDTKLKMPNKFIHKNKRSKKVNKQNICIQRNSSSVCDPISARLFLFSFLSIFYYDSCVLYVFQMSNDIFLISKYRDQINLLRKYGFVSFNPIKLAKSQLQKRIESVFVICSVKLKSVIVFYFFLRFSCWIKSVMGRPLIPQVPTPTLPPGPSGVAKIDFFTMPPFFVLRAWLSQRKIYF